MNNTAKTILWALAFIALTAGMLGYAVKRYDAAMEKCKASGWSESRCAAYL